MNDDILSQLTAASPRRVLEDLARIGLALAKNDRARPEVECYLASGQLVRGRVVAVADDRQGAVAVLAVGGNVRAPSVTFIRVDQIAAVTVVDASLLVRAPVVDSPIPSKLELQRQLAARADSLANAIGHRIEIALGGASELDDDGRRAVGAALPLIVEVLAAIASDDMGREALRKIETLELGAGSSGDVGTYDSGHRLVIRAPKLLTEQYTAATLRRAIEKLL